MVPRSLILFDFRYAEDIFDRCGPLLIAAHVGSDEPSHFLNRRHPYVVKDQNSAQVEHAVGAEEIHQGVVEGVGTINVDVIRFKLLPAQIRQGSDRGLGDMFEFALEVQLRHRLPADAVPH